jgi:adenosylmethionine-8-amino-7-oxononanoate aminotransferase
MAAMSATGMAVYHKMFGPLVPGFIQVAPPYPYRWQGNEDPGSGAAEAVERAIVAEGPDTVAAVICEPVMGAGGVIVPPDTYFPKLREICDHYEVLLIADEVITGFGRTGRWFALGHWGVEPDIVSFAKGVTSGYLPLGGNILSKRVHDAILSAPLDRRYMHAATYSGHPVCCAVGLRNVEILEEEKLVERSAEMGKKLLAGLEELYNLPNVGEVRGLGMMCGVELVADKSSKAPALGLGVKVAREAMARGLLVRARPGSADPAMGDTLCLSPPLSTPAETLERIPQILRDAILAATA